MYNSLHAGFAPREIASGDVYNHASDPRRPSDRSLLHDDLIAISPDVQERWQADGSVTTHEMVTHSGDPAPRDANGKYVKWSWGQVKKVHDYDFTTHNEMPWKSPLDTLKTRAYQVRAPQGVEIPVSTMPASGTSMHMFMIPLSEVASFVESLIRYMDQRAVIYYDVINDLGRKKPIGRKSIPPPTEPTSNIKFPEPTQDRATKFRTHFYPHARGFGPENDAIYQKGNMREKEFRQRKNRQMSTNFENMDLDDCIGDKQKEAWCRYHANKKASGWAQDTTGQRRSAQGWEDYYKNRDEADRQARSTRNKWGKPSAGPA